MESGRKMAPQSANEENCHCNHCGEPLPNRGRFCGHCGTERNSALRKSPATKSSYGGQSVSAQVGWAAGRAFRHFVSAGPKAWIIGALLVCVASIYLRISRTAGNASAKEESRLSPSCSGKPRPGMPRQTTTAQKSTGSSLARRRVSSSATNQPKGTDPRGQRPRS